MNEPKFLDPAIKRKNLIVEKSLQLTSEGWPLPAVVEISESGTCNRKCSFCPRSDESYPDIQEFIDPDLLTKLVSELSSYGFTGLFLFSGFVEPMIDKNIYRLISIVKTFLPKARIEMVTNGDALNLGRIKKLMDAGLSSILISVYDGPEDADRFQNLCKEAGLSDSQFVIRHRYLPPEKNFGITLNNRAGMMQGAEFSVKKLEKKLSEPCFYPHYTFFMDYLGDVLICPHDWGKKRIAGNLSHSTFKELWLNKIFMDSRSKLGDGNRSLVPCNVCDVKGTLIGSIHKDAW